ncbi:MAG: PTS sugar transporter subunit IIA [Gammaproteobacteria bacterium]|nr:PTS sugar transporter subunit IIA [Gammaproteobacteria bacterium]
MRLSSLVDRKNIVLGLKARNLQEATREILDRAAAFSPGLPLHEVHEAVMMREALSSTALGVGIALPHARIPDLEGFTVLVGIPENDLTDKGIDGRPVGAVFLLLTNDHLNTLLLQALAALSQLMQQDRFVDRLREAGTVELVWNEIHGSNVDVRKKLEARDLMTSAFVQASADMTLHQLLDLMFENGIDDAVVLNSEHHILGTVTSREIIGAGFPDYMSSMDSIGFLKEYESFEEFFKKENKIVVAEFMNKEAIIVEASDPLIQVVFRMFLEKERIAFVQEDEVFVGVIDRNDIINHILRA